MSSLFTQSTTEPVIATCVPCSWCRHLVLRSATTPSAVDCLSILPRPLASPSGGSDLLWPLYDTLQEKEGLGSFRSSFKSHLKTHYFQLENYNLCLYTIKTLYHIIFILKLAYNLQLVICLSLFYPVIH